MCVYTATQDWLRDVRFGGTTAVPEPSTTALLGLGAVSLILRRRK
ncbi:PEP-CTERM sorting domain-containing protein [Rubritalea tangerina]|uniref:PEP-CTERM sorting domain-containing protein n=1 Tax=Rubritalea tangerina TaxID=430798 RepID=A0ABW4Z9N4_9BACT